MAAENAPVDMPAGRPTDYNQDIASAICARIITGMSLRSICGADDMPDASTVFQWIQRHKEFAQQYAIACEERSEALVEEILDIADDGSNDWMADNDPDNPGYKMNGEAMQRSRLRVDTRKWYASKLKPKKYGERQQIDHTITSVSDQMRGILDAGNTAK